MSECRESTGCMPPSNAPNRTTGRVGGMRSVGCVARHARITRRPNWSSRPSVTRLPTSIWRACPPVIGCVRRVAGISITRARGGRVLSIGGGASLRRMPRRGSASSGEVISIAGCSMTRRYPILSPWRSPPVTRSTCCCWPLPAAAPPASPCNSSSRPCGLTLCCGVPSRIPSTPCAAWGMASRRS